MGGACARLGGVRSVHVSHGWDLIVGCALCGAIATRCRDGVCSKEGWVSLVVLGTGPCLDVSGPGSCTGMACVGTAVI